MESKEILYHIKYLVNFLKRETWKNKFTKQVEVSLKKEQRDLIKTWLVEIRPKLSHLFLRNYYLLSDSGEETLKDIVKKLDSNENPIIFTEYDLGFMVFWLHKTRKGLDDKLSLEDYIIYLEILNLFNSVITSDELKEVVEKIIKKTMEDEVIY